MSELRTEKSNNHIIVDVDIFDCLLNNTIRYMHAPVIRRRITLCIIFKYSQEGGESDLAGKESCVGRR